MQGCLLKYISGTNLRAMQNIRIILNSYNRKTVVIAMKNEHKQTSTTATSCSSTSLSFQPLSAFILDSLESSKFSFLPFSPTMTKYKKKCKEVGGLSDEVSNAHAPACFEAPRELCTTAVWPLLDLFVKMSLVLTSFSHITLVNCDANLIH